MTDQSKTSNQRTLKDTHNAISSQGLADGHTPYNSQDGQQIDLFGQDHAPVSRSAPLGDKKVKPTSVTYGHSGTASSESVGLQSCLENRLRQRLPTGGLTMFIKGWRPKVTPSGRQYCQLAVSVRPIEETDCGLWPTPKASDGNNGTRTAEGAMKEMARAKSPDLATMTCAFALCPTPNASDNRDRGSIQNPCVQRRIKLGKQIGLTMLAQGIGKAYGSTAQTGNKGSLNPQFVCWLMGFPNEWLVSMVSAMQSYRKSRRSSSKRIKI